MIFESRLITYKIKQLYQNLSLIIYLMHYSFVSSLQDYASTRAAIQVEDIDLNMISPRLEDLKNHFQNVNKKAEEENKCLLEENFNKIVFEQLEFCEKIFKNQCLPNCLKIHPQQKLFSNATVNKIKQKINLRPVCPKIACIEQTEEHLNSKFHFQQKYLEKILSSIYYELNLAHQFFIHNPSVRMTQQKFRKYLSQNQEISQYNGFNTVIKMKEKASPKTTFIKKESKNILIEIKKNGLSMQESHIWTEIRLLSYMKKNHCPYVIEIQGIVVERKTVCMILQAGEKSLKQAINQRRKNKKPFTQSEVFNIFMSILNGLEYIHEHWYHLDIKPDNIVKCGEIWKIIDFQSAVQKDRIIKYTIGTQSYQAPELLKFFNNKQQSYGNFFDVPINNQIKGNYIPSGREDIYSFGVTMYNVLTLNNQYNINDPKKSMIDKNKKNNRQLQLITIIERMLKINPSQRPTLKQLKTSSIIVQDLLNTYINNHLVFCLDSSGSMKGNPWGYVIEAFEKFNLKRQDKAFDRISVIVFNNESYLKCEMKKWDEINIKECLKYIGGWTNYDNALSLCSHVLQRNCNFVQKSSLIFMSDGECDNGIEEAKNIYNQFKQRKKEIKAAFLACGIDAKQKKLEKLCEQFQNKGTFFICQSDKEIVMYFDHISKLMI